MAVFRPENFPLDEDQTIVTRNQSVEVKDQGGETANGLADVSSGVLNRIVLNDNFAIINDTQAVTVGGSTYTFTVVDGAITAIAVS